VFDLDPQRPPLCAHQSRPSTWGRRPPAGGGKYRRNFAIIQAVIQRYIDRAHASRPPDPGANSLKLAALGGQRQLAQGAAVQGGGRSSLHRKKVSDSYADPKRLATRIRKSFSTPSPMEGRAHRDAVPPASEAALIGQEGHVFRHAIARSGNQRAIVTRRPGDRKWPVETGRSSGPNRASGLKLFIHSPKVGIGEVLSKGIVLIARFVQGGLSKIRMKKIVS